MAATADITINNNAAVAKTFSPSIQVPNGYQYRETGSPADAPRTLDVLHVIANAASSSNSKHTLLFKQLRANGASLMRTGYIKTEISVPKDGLTATDVSDLAAFIRNFLTDANLQKVLLGGF